MITKTVSVLCDHEGCWRFHEGTPGESRATPAIKQIRALGWVASDGRQYCPQHAGDAASDREGTGLTLRPRHAVE